MLATGRIMKNPDKIPLPRATLTSLSQTGIDLLNILQQADISSIVLSQDRIHLSTKQYFAFWQAVEEQSNNPLLALHIDQKNHYALCDPAVLIMLHSPTFCDALHYFARYKRLVCPQILQIEKSATETALSWSWATTQMTEPNMVVDLFLSSVLAIFRQTVGQEQTPLRIALSRHDVPHDYAKFFGCPVVVNAPKNRIIFATHKVEKALNQYNPELLRMLLPSLDAQIEQCFQNLEQQIKRAICQQLNGYKPSIEDIANRLFISSRTLQRRLQQENLSFQQLLTDTRCEVAEQLLKQNEMEIGEIAYYLGYQEVTSFNRAFSQIKGVTPLQWRKQWVKNTE